jgi:hypothetical protein
MELEALNQLYVRLEMGHQMEETTEALITLWVFMQKLARFLPLLLLVQMVLVLHQLVQHPLPYHHCEYLTDHLFRQLM